MDIQIAALRSVDNLVTGTRSEWKQCIQRLVAVRGRVHVHYVIHTITIGDESWRSELDAMLALMSIDEHRKLFEKLKGRWFGYWSLPILVKYNLNINSLSVSNKSDGLIAAMSSVGFVHTSGRVTRTARYRWLRLRQRLLLLSVVKYWSHCAAMPDSKLVTRLITKYNSIYKPV